MGGIETLRQMHTLAEEYRKTALCASCREDADVIIDFLDKQIEFEGLMHEYVAVGARHAASTQLPDRTRQVVEARNEVARRLGRSAAPSPQEVHARPGDIVRSWRTDLGEMIPRPLGLRRPARRA